MNSYSDAAMIGFDLMLILLMLAVIASFIRYGVFQEESILSTARTLMIAGIAVPAIYGAADLFFVLGLPAMIGEDAARQIARYHRVEIQLVASLVSLILVSGGAIAAAVQRRPFEQALRRSRDQVADAEQAIVRSEARFRSLLEHAPDAIYCLEFKPPVPINLPLDEQIARSGDAVLVECNTGFAVALGHAAPAAALGIRFREVDSFHDTKSHQRFYRRFVESGYRLQSYELEFTDRQNKANALRISFTGVVEDGALVRIWGAEHDILEKKQTEAALDERRRFQDFVAAMSSLLIATPENRADDTLRLCLEHSCNFFAYERANIIWFDKRNFSLRVLYFWNEMGLPPQVELSLTNFPWAGTRLFTGKPIRISNAGDFPAEGATDATSFEKLGLKSFAAVPMIIGNDTLGALTFGATAKEIAWTDQDMADLQVIADLFTNVVARISGRTALDAALSELQSATERLEAENVYLREEISSTHSFDEIIGESTALRRCLVKVEQVATTTTTVLIQGETGTGKELIARAIHDRSDRRRRPLVKVNCAALPANLIESELFGHEKGAFTGAVSKKSGRFDLADGGTLFLDEIGDFPLELQGKLLRVLQEGEYQRLGGTETVRVDVRLIAATNRDLQKAVDNAEFRADLFYRINTFPVNVPRLADREGDIPLLARHFARKFATVLGKEVTAISSDMMGRLISYQWPGNVRELEGVIQRALISGEGPVLELPDAVDRDIRHDAGDSNEPESSAVGLTAAERNHIERVLQQSRWIIGGSGGAAALLGVPPSTLRSKMKKLGIVRPRSLSMADKNLT